MSDTLSRAGQPTDKAKVKPNHYRKPGDTGNCVGCVVPKTSPHLSPPNDKPETEQESGWDNFVNGTKERLKDAAQWYEDNLSQPLHQFGSDAMSTGGNIATAGGAAAAAGGAMVTTGVGAAPGAVIAAGGAATAAVGGGVSAVGAGADTVATAMDSAAQWAKTGKAPDLVSQLLAQGQRMLTNLVLKKVPGVGGTGENSATQRATGTSGGHIKKDCKPLQNGLPGAGYRGGRHGNIQKGGSTYSPPRESHHVPAKSTYQSINGNPISDDNKPAFQMDKEDHAQTASHDHKPGAAAYRQAQTALIQSGKTGVLAAMMMDFKDIESKFPGKYTSAMSQMMAWAKCMGYI